MLDFGLARLEDEVTMSGVMGHGIVGTPSYLSPEALRRTAANPAFDLWALAVVVFEMLTGRRPFEGEDRDALINAIKNGRAHSITEHLPGSEKGLQEFFDAAFDLTRRSSGAPRRRRSLAGGSTTCVLRSSHESGTSRTLLRDSRSRRDVLGRCPAHPSWEISARARAHRLARWRSRSWPRRNSSLAGILGSP